MPRAKSACKILGRRCICPPKFALFFSAGQGGLKWCVDVDFGRFFFANVVANAQNTNAQLALNTSCAMVLWGNLRTNLSIKNVGWTFHKGWIRKCVKVILLQNSNPAPRNKIIICHQKVGPGRLPTAFPFNVKKRGTECVEVVCRGRFMPTLFRQIWSSLKVEMLFCVRREIRSDLEATLQTFNILRDSVG